VFDPVTFDLLRFASDYYHHPLGEVIAAALPAALRQGQAANAAADLWSLSEAGRRELASPTSRRGPRQRALLKWFAERAVATADEVTDAFKPEHLKTLARRGWVLSRRAPIDATPDPAPVDLHPGDVSPTEAQIKIIDAITASFGRYAAHLLYGVTGSGKTEVYLRVIAESCARGGQALVLVPEIALTPQLVDRFRRRFNAGIAVLHSALSGTERRAAWRAAYGGRAGIVIGTRSAIFTALPPLALITSSTKDFAIRPATLPCGGPSGRRCPSSWVRPRPRLKPLKTRRRVAMRNTSCRSVPEPHKRRAWRWWICAGTPASRASRSRRCRRSDVT
jgi:primosomal protein N' (replication factor Y)